MGWEHVFPLEIHVAVVGRTCEPQICLRGCDVWAATPRDGGEIPGNPLWMVCLHPGAPIHGASTCGAPSGELVYVKHLLDEWVPPQRWEGWKHRKL